jgi:cytochrome P450
MGYALPPGTLVATQAWSVHRTPSVFPSPDSFLPERWLETGGNKEQLEVMNRYMMPFGTGSRVCGGQNLAQMVLRIAIAAIARNFDIVSPPETTETSMEMRDSFVCYSFRTSHLSETIDVVYPGYLSGINGLSSDLQPTQDSINSQIGTACFPAFVF